MTKSEAKAIEQRATKLVQCLNGVCGADGALDWNVIAQGGQAVIVHVNDALKVARDNACELLEMASAELGGKR